MMKHLRGGVKKGAFDEAAAQTKFDAWKQAKVAKLTKVSTDEANAKKADANARLEAEKKINEAIAQKVAEKKAAIEAAKAEAAAAAQAEAEASAAAQDAPAEAPAEA